MPQSRRLVLVTSSWLRFKRPSKVVAKAKAAPKAATKPKTATTKPKSKAPLKKKVFADHDNNAEDSIMDVDSDVEGDEMRASTSQTHNPEKKKKTATETYTKVFRIYSLPFVSLNRFISSLNLNTFSSVLTRTLAVLKPSHKQCGHTTMRPSAWFIGRSSTSRDSSRLSTKS